MTSSVVGVSVDGGMISAFAVAVSFVTVVSSPGVTVLICSPSSVVFAGVVLSPWSIRLGTVVRASLGVCEMTRNDFVVYRLTYQLADTYLASSIRRSCAWGRRMSLT